MADGSLGGKEWSNFGDFSTSSCNNLDQFGSFETDKSSSFQVDTTEPENEEKEVSGYWEWNANFADAPEPAVNNSEDDFGSFGNFEDTPHDGFEDENLESLTRNLISNHFSDSKCLTKVITECSSSLNKMFIQSTLSGVLLSTGFDPVKSNETHFHQLKNENILSMLCGDQVVENWISILNKADTRAYHDDFDFHDTTGKQKRLTTSSSLSIYKNSTNNIPNGNKQPLRETILKDNSAIAIDKKVESNIIKVHTHQKSQLPQLENAMKKTSSELEGKSLEEVKNLVYELELQANIYSELLCNELDYRDKLKRDIEGQNNFISTYVAVERKLNNSIQDKKKKNRYGFFKANDDDHNKPPVSIPYIQREGGPKPADLTLIKDILKAIENDDPGVSKLISDYVLNLGEQHNLQTVIQVRTRNGVTSLSAPQHKKKNLDGVDEL